MKISRYFIYSYAIIILLIILSILAIHIVRSQREIRRLSSEYSMLNESVLKRLELAAGIREKKGELEKKRDTLRAKYLEEAANYISEKDEEYVKNLVLGMVKETGFSFKSIEKGENGEGEIFSRFNFILHINGNIYNLPNLLELYFRQKRKTTISRITAESPSFFSTRMNLKIYLTYYQLTSLAEENPGREEEILKDFTIPMKRTDPSRLPPRLSGLYKQVQRNMEKLRSYHPDILEYERLKRYTKRAEEVLEACDALTLEKVKNYRTLMENIPNLYGRVRNSPLGMASIVLKGDEILFPDFAE